MRPGSVVTHYIGTPVDRYYIAYRVQVDGSLGFILQSNDLSIKQSENIPAPEMVYSTFDEIKSANDGEYPEDFWVDGSPHRVPEDLLPEICRPPQVPLVQTSYFSTEKYHALDPDEDWEVETTVKGSMTIEELRQKVESDLHLNGRYSSVVVQIDFTDMNK